MVLSPHAAAIFHGSQEELQITLHFVSRIRSILSHSHVSQLILLLQVIQKQDLGKSSIYTRHRAEKGLRLAAPALSCIFQEQAEKKIFPIFVLFFFLLFIKKKSGYSSLAASMFQTWTVLQIRKSPHCSSECERL